MEGLKNAPRNSNNGSFTKQQKTDKLAQQKRAILELVNVADAKTTQVYFFGPTFKHIFHHHHHHHHHILQITFHKSKFFIC